MIMKYVLKYNNKNYVLKANGKNYVLAVNPDNQTGGDSDETIYYTLTINAIPENAIVTINGEVTNSVTLAEGSEVMWTVSADGYVEKNGVVLLYKDTTIDVELDAYKYYTLTINPTPSDATVVINGIKTNSVTVLENTDVVFDVFAEGFYPQSSSIKMTKDETIDVILEEEEQPQGELNYALYVGADMGEYFYAKAPLGEDFIKYGVDFYGSRKATDISEIKPVVSPGNGATQYWEYVTEDYAEVSLFTFNRDKTGDFYI